MAEVVNKKVVKQELTSCSGRGHQAGVERLEEAEARLMLLMLLLMMLLMLPREVTLAASSTL
jgi:hypothetical protein